MKAIVIGRNYTSMLGMIRPAGLAGCDVIAIRTVKNLKEREQNKNVFSEDPIEKDSKFVRQHYIVEQRAEELIHLLLTKCVNDGEKSIILPCDDFAASVVDLNLDQLREFFLYPSINDSQGSIVHIMDKKLQKTIAKQVGLNVAEGWLIQIHDGKFSIPQDIVYPVFVKPDVSYIISKNYMRRCNSEEELLRLINDVIKTQECPLLAEQFIDIEHEYGILGVSDSVHSVIPGIVKKISIGHGVHNGVTLVGEYSSFFGFGELREKLLTFMAQVGLQGLFDIDLYESKGKIYFNELNLRLGAFGFTALRAGYNLPKMLIESLMDNKSVTDQVFQGKIRCISEKVNLEDYYNGYITWAQYNENIKNADYGFIKFEEDMDPYFRFQKNVKKMHLKREIKNILHKK